MIQRRFSAIGAIAIALAVLLSCGGAPARAQTSGLYVAGGGGLDWLRNTRAETNTGQGAAFTFETGWIVSATLGYGFGNGLRVEGEAAFRRNALDKADGASGAGGVASQSLMINALYDLGTWSGFTPYLGAGGGVAHVHAVDFIVPDNVAIGGADTVPAWQGLLGVAYAVTDRWKLDLGYRYFKTSPPQFSVRSSGGGGGGGGGNSTSAEVGYRHQVALLQLRYEFGAAR